jgi:hypothetical protein
MTSEITRAGKWPIQAPRFDETDERIDVRNVVVEGRVLDIGIRSGHDVIGWDVELRACEIRLHAAAKNAVVLNAKFSDCRFLAMRKQENLNWHNAIFEHCVFKGTFLFCSFGFGAADDPTRPAGLRWCDFSDARLDSCTLGNTDLSSLVLPKEPHLTFFEPGKHQDAIKAIVPEWPVQGFLENTALHEDTCSAVAYSQQFLDNRNFPAAQYELLLRRCRELDFIRINF